MTANQMRERAQKYRNCGLETDALMIEAAAALVDAQPRCMHRENGGPECPCLHSQALARLEAVPNESINR